MKRKNAKTQKRRKVRGADPTDSAIRNPQSAIALRAEATFDLTAAAEDGEAKRPTFDILAYTGGLLRVAYWYYPVAIDLSGLQARQDVSVLLDHQRDQIVGQSTKVKIGTRTLALSGIVTGPYEIEDQPAWTVVSNARNGFKWKASVGVESSAVEFVEANVKAKVNGRSITGPAYVIRQGRLGEVSFVAVDADGNSAANVAATHHTEVTDMNFEQWLQANGFDPEAVTDEQRPALEAAWKASVAAAGEPDPDDDNPGDPGGNGQDGDPGGNGEDPPGSAESAAAVALQAHVGQVRKATAAELRRTTAIQKVCGSNHPELCAQAIEENWTADRTQLAVYKADMPKVGAAGGDRGDNGHAIEAALCMSAGIPEARCGELYDERTMNAALAPDLRGAGLHTLLFSVCAAAGEHVRPGQVNNDLIRAALSADQRLVQAAPGGFSTISLSGILSNLANKMMLEAYSAVAAVAGLFCGTADHGDFKTHTKYRMTGVGAFEAVAPDGEIKHITLGEASYTNVVDTKGGLLALTRQMMINDDLSAFNQIARIIGRMGAIALEKAVFTLLLGNSDSFFHADNSNLLTGAGSALSIDGLTAAEQTMRDQKDANNDPVLISPAVVLTGTGLAVYAQQLFKDLNVNETTTANKPKPTSNPHAGKFQPVSSPYVNAQGLPSSSATKWWLFANPNDVAAIEIAYLRGARVPTIESAETNFATLGMQWRGYFDFGVAWQDPSGAVQNDGA
ncbi:MAG: hypothetical protein GY778_13610 [bacterium]|nr:hypothetical protein [bacterium]